jgi:Pyruvate/2-oxoacid:ferredoxin oxidoreductase delta subunit
MGSDVGSDWYELTGEWGIAGFALVEKYGYNEGTADAVIICTRQQPADHAGEQILSVDVFSPQTGDKYYLYACVGSSTSVATATIIEFECTSAPSQWTVRAGSETQTYTSVTPNILGYVRIGACVDANAGMIKASISYTPEPQLWDDNATTTSGRYSAIGHDNTGHQNQFDNYFVMELRTGDDDVICDSCFCYCLEKAIPKTLTLRVTEALDRYDCFGGYECELEWDPLDENWKGEFTVVNGSKSQTMQWCLDCESFGQNDPAKPGQNLKLSLCIGTGCCTEWPDQCLTVWEPLAGSTCNPLELIYGPMNTSINELQCSVCYDPYFEGPLEGTMKVTITE